MIEALFIIILTFTSGYGTRYFTEPEKICKEIIYEADTRLYKDDLTLPAICAEGIDKDNREIECYVDSRLKYSILPQNWQQIESIIIESGTALKGCIEAKDKYNKDKFIMKD